MKEIVLALICLTILACSSNTTDTPEAVRLIVDQIEVQDVGDSGNPSDILVSFNKIMDETPVAEYRIFVTNNDNALTTNEASSIEESLYISIEPRGSQINIALPESFTDTSGELLKEDIDYWIWVLAIAKTENELFTSGLSEPKMFRFGRVNKVSTLAQGFSASGGMAVNSNGDIYIADFGTGADNGTEILRVSADGSNIEKFADGLLGPTGGVFSEDGTLYWSSYSGNTVHSIDQNGEVSSFATVSGPVAIVLQENGNLLVASCDSNRIMSIDANGTTRTFASSSLFQCPNGLAADDSGNIYACNFEDGSIFKINPNGTVELFASIPSGSSVNLDYANDRLFVTGRKAHVIYTVSTQDGSVELLAGTGQRGRKDGDALEATFSFPNGIAINAERNRIYINDVAVNSGSNSNGVNFNPNTLRVIDIVK